MAQNTNNNNILSVLENFTLDNSDDIAREVAENFRKRRVEKTLHGNTFPNCRECLCLPSPDLSKRGLLPLNRL